MAQWEGIRAVIAERGLFPWFDCAYQGFASGDPETDVAAVRMFEREVRRGGGRGG